VINQPAVGVEKGYDSAGLWAAIVVMFAWHVISVLPTTISGWLTVGFVASNAAFWFVYAAIGGIVTWVVLRGGGQSLALALAVCPILLVGVAIGSLAAPGGFFGRYNWAFAVCGWFALVALWRRRLTELLTFFAANWLIGVAVLIAQHQTSRLSIAQFIVDSVGTSVLQVTIFVGGKTVAATARRAAEAEDTAAQSRIARLAAEAVQAARRANYEAIRGTVAGLLDGLAEGKLDVTAPGARQEVAVAVMRLRRYLVEPDKVPDQLSHELDACADAAERRGIAVDLIASAGTVPSLPLEIRRALTEPIIQVLSVAVTQARITVVASAFEVVVAIVADAYLEVPIEPLHHAVHLAQDSEGDRLWVQASWTDQSPSPS
jgi:hypothetical protein